MMTCSGFNNFFLRVKIDKVRRASVWCQSNFGFSGPVLGTIGGMTEIEIKLLKPMKIILSYLAIL